jgi:glycosyltransferase involved in cell wall biosynthesis
MSPIRVCAVTCDCYPEDPLVRRTAEAGVSAYEYHVLCSMAEGETPYEVFNGVHVHRIRINRHGKAMGRITAMSFVQTIYYWTLFTFLAAFRLLKLHRKYKFDVIHIHNLPDYLVFAAFFPKMMGAQVILQIQDITPELMAVKSSGFSGRMAVLLAKWQERMSTAFADHVLTVGWPFEPPLLERGVPREKLSSVLNSADPSIFREDKRTPLYVGDATPERPIVLMYHGTMAARNGIDTAIRAFAKAHAVAPYLQLHLNGDGEALPGLKQLAKELGVADQVVFFPRRPLHKLADFVSSGDIGIIPYPTDGFMELVLPTKSYEYAQMRRPMIASDTIAIRSLFRPESVMLCEPANPDSFAQAIVDLYQHPAKRAELMDNATQDYAEFRWEFQAERYRALIASLAEKRAEKAGLKSVGITE